MRVLPLRESLTEAGRLRMGSRGDLTRAGGVSGVFEVGHFRKKHSDCVEKLVSHFEVNPLI
jgi:hypothetical protein